MSFQSSRAGNHPSARNPNVVNQENHMQIKNIQHLAEYLSYCLGEDLDFGVYVNRSPERLVELLKAYDEVSAMEDWFKANN
jgi:hypothetical protein